MVELARGAHVMNEAPLYSLVLLYQIEFSMLNKVGEKKLCCFVWDILYFCLFQGEY